LRLIGSIIDALLDQCHGQCAQLETPDYRADDRLLAPDSAVNPALNVECPLAAPLDLGAMSGSKIRPRP
jgi:hypothetical protein